MTPRTLSRFLTLFVAASLPLSVLAHETQNFTIGDKEYSFVIGSLNEPLVVDDKSGVELMVAELGEHSEVTESEDGDAHEEGSPVEGLDQALKVEIIAGDKKKVLELTPMWGEPGSYKAVFFPTVQTTLTYRFFGRINNTAIDLSFSCNPAGHPQVADDVTEKEIAKNVIRTLKRGSFGCPLAKADLGFPEPSVTMTELTNSSSAGSLNAGVIGLIAGILGLVVAIGAWVKIGRKPSQQP